MEHIVGCGVDEALIGRVRFRLRCFPASTWAGRQLALNQLLVECLLDAAMERGVELGRWCVCSREVALNGERVGPVVAVVDDASAGESAAEAQVCFGECRLYLGDPLGVAEGDCGLSPPIMPERCDAFGECVEQGSVDGHVGGGVAKGVGQDDEWHGKSGLCVG